MNNIRLAILVYSVLLSSSSCNDAKPPQATTTPQIIQKRSFNPSLDRLGFFVGQLDIIDENSMHRFSSTHYVTDIISVEQYSQEKDKEICNNIRKWLKDKILPQNGFRIKTYAKFHSFSSLQNAEIAYEDFRDLPGMEIEGLEAPIFDKAYSAGNYSPRYSEYYSPRIKQFDDDPPPVMDTLAAPAADTTAVEWLD